MQCKAEFLARGFLARSERYLLWGFGDAGKALAEALAQRGKHPAAIIELHPRRVGQLIRGVRVVAPAALPTLPRLPLIVSGQGSRLARRFEPPSRAWAIASSWTMSALPESTASWSGKIHVDL